MKRFLMMCFVLVLSACGTRDTDAGNATEAETVAQSAPADVPVPENGEELPEEEEGKEEEKGEDIRYDRINVFEGYRVPENTFTDRTVKDDYYHMRDNDIEIDIYNLIALDKLLGKKNVTLSDIEEAVRFNPRIPPEFKEKFIEFADTMMSFYPGIDMRLFYENMKDIEVREPTEEEKEKNGNVVAWYHDRFNIMYLSDLSDFSEGSEGIMILRHELGHTISLGKISHDYKRLYCDYANQEVGNNVREAACVILTTYPWQDRYDTEDLGFPLISNELRMILEATPGFDVRMLAIENVDGLIRFLDERLDNEISARDLMRLLEDQTNSYYRLAETKYTPDEYDKIYAYIADTYITNVLYPGMPYEEMMEIYEYLDYHLTKCLDRTDLVNTSVIRERFEKYWNENNITRP